MYKEELLRLIKDARTINTNNGWTCTNIDDYYSRPKFVITKFELQDTELSKLTESVRNQLKSDNAIENMYEEVADYFIRGFDLFGDYEPFIGIYDSTSTVIENIPFFEDVEDMLVFISDIREILSDAKKFFKRGYVRISAYLFAITLVELEEMVLYNDGDIVTEIEKKNEKNSKRGYKHGGKTI